ncbi:substrate-binding domain-containing protein [Falsiroseomonas tokyonensis]|uniref:Substrate-binding domain-containing protein n=1 Tax=Falsiroseomonas tokyonensis TaxID=430521 RepID=A0ABV7BPI3_9PROT|nr:substrate-binding domain-containing protein [Falsiroseomonas tokyonensis]MBU8536551.1 substrate-binding domain-containing protein [Falsiroseomonas tokyonensis]
MEHARARFPQTRPQTGPMEPARLARRRLAQGLLAALALPGLARAAAGPLRVGGTGMGLAITNIMLDLHAGTEDLTESTVLPSLGTAGGLAALRSGRVEIALSARALRPEEAAQGLEAFAFGRTPLAFATRYDTPSRGISLAQAAAMLGGEEPSWPGGGAVRVVLRDRSETDWIMLAAASEGMAAAMQRAHARSGLALASTDQENADLLESLPGSLGLTTLGLTLSEQRRLRLLALDGAVPDLASMAAGDYRFSRILYAVVRNDAPVEVRRFVQFLGSPRARQGLRSFGFAPLLGGET